MNPGFNDDETAIAYGVSLAVIVVLSLMGIWVTMAPIVDALRDVTVDLNADSPDMFSNELVTRVNNVYEIWGMIVFTFIIVPFIYIIVRSIRQQGVE